jgi:hypothetical protein
MTTVAYGYSADEDKETLEEAQHWHRCRKIHGKPVWQRSECAGRLSFRSSELQMVE